MTTIYILYSATLDKYYCGVTEMSVEERLARHLDDHGGFTSIAKDWVCVYTEAIENKSDALRREKQIKKRGIKRYLESNKQCG